MPLSRRHLLATPLAAPALAQEVRPIRIGVTADMSGTFVDTTGPGQTVATQLAVGDFGGTLRGRPIQVLQADDQNRPDIGNTVARAVQAAGGRMLGSVRVPLGTTDHASHLLQAQAARPAVVGLVTAGQDLVNAVTQAAEFGLARPGSNIRVAGLSLLAKDVPGIGLAAAQGLIASERFYWDRNDGTRDVTRRLQARRPRMPNMPHAGCYSAAMHRIRAVAAEGGLDGAVITRRLARSLRRPGGDRHPAGRARVPPRRRGRLHPGSLR
jgi:ABC-type branched-subunit amino acid transport system substrate-binding protein